MANPKLQYLGGTSEQRESTGVVLYGENTIAGMLDKMRVSPFYAYMGALSEGSRPSALSTLRMISRYLYDLEPGQAPWQTMTVYQFNQIKDQFIRTGYAPKTTHRALCMVRSVLKKARSMQMIPPEFLAEYDTIMATDNVKGSQGRGLIAPHRSLTDEEINQLFTLLGKDSTPAGLRDMAILSLMRGTGIRRIEVANLMFEDIRWGAGPHGELRLRRTKGDKVRVVPMPAGLREILTRWLAYRGEDLGYLFMALHRTGKIMPAKAGKGKSATGRDLALPEEAKGQRQFQALDRSSINRMMDKRLRQAGIEKATPHDLRYTFAVKNLRRSDLQTVADLLGHSSVTTTSIYTETTMEQMVAVVSQEDVFKIYGQD